MIVEVKDLAVNQNELVQEVQVSLADIGSLHVGNVLCLPLVLRQRPQAQYQEGRPCSIGFGPAAV